MSYVEPPRSNKDKSVTYRVRWREGAAQPVVSFCTRDLGDQAQKVAEQFRDLVNAAGDTMPTREQLAPYGLDWILGAPDTAPAAPAAPAEFVSVAEMVRRYLQWLRTKATPPSKRTLDEYDGYLRRDIEPRKLGAVDCATAEFEDIDNWQVELLTVPGPYARKAKSAHEPPPCLSPNSVRKVRQSLLAPAFTWACSQRSGRPPLRARSSPLNDSELPRADPKFVRDILETPDEYALFVKEAYAVDPNWAKMVATVATTAMRFGDVVQLGPQSVNPRRHTLRITHRFSAGSVEEGRKNGDEGTVPVPEWMTSHILLPAISRGGQHLFVGPAGNRWSYATEWDRWDLTRKRLAASGLHVHLTHHCLRHGLRRWLSSNKIDKTKIDAMMGHRERTMGDRYDGLTAADRAEIREVTTALLPESAWLAAAA